MKVPFYSSAVFLGIFSLLCSCTSPTPPVVAPPHFKIHGHFSADQLIDPNETIKHIGENQVKKIQCAYHDPNPIVYIFGKVTESINDENGNKIGGKIGWPPTLILSGEKSFKNKTNTDFSFEAHQLYDLPNYIDFNSMIVAENLKRDIPSIITITGLNKSADSKDLMLKNIKTKRKVQEDLTKLAESRKTGDRTANMFMSSAHHLSFRSYPYDKRRISKKELEFRKEIDGLIKNSPSKDECRKLSAG